jgi:hypothetical protein
MRGRRWRSRAGQSPVEFALVFPILALMIFTFMDLSRAVFYYNSVSRAARAGTRYAIVHGKFSGAPVPLDTSGAHSCGDALNGVVLSWLPGLAASDVEVKCFWDSGVDMDPDLYNDRGNHVQVDVKANYWPVIPFYLGSGPVVLPSSSIMAIVN